MGLLPFVRRDTAYMLVLGMTGIKMGDRLVLLGCEDGGRLGAIAAKVGLSGQAVALLADDKSASRARQGATRAGVLVEVELAQPTSLPTDNRVFDVAVVDDTAGLLGSLAPRDRAKAIEELLRLLRPGGRVVVIGGGARGGLGAMLGIGAKERPAATPDVMNQALAEAGFKSVRTLAERDGLFFIEGLKPR